MTAARRLDLWTLILVGAWVVVGLLLLLPLGSVFRASLIGEDGSFSLAN